MSTKLGPIKYEEAQGSPFMGRDYGKNKSFSDSIALEIDKEIKIMIEDAQAVAYKIIKSNMKLLELIKTSLLEKETIVAEEIEYIAEHLALPPKIEKTEVKAKKVNLEDLIDEVETETENINLTPDKDDSEEVKESTTPVEKESDKTSEKKVAKKTTTTKLKNTSTTKVKKESDKTSTEDLKTKKDK
jgi:cell division protease FtsH